MLKVVGVHVLIDEQGTKVGKRFGVLANAVAFVRSHVSSVVSVQVDLEPSRAGIGGVDVLEAPEFLEVYAG